MDLEPRSTTPRQQVRAGKQCLAAMLLAAATTFGLTTAPEASPFVPGISGTWEIVGTPQPNDCGVNESFTGIATITFDGILTTVDPISGRTAVGEVFRLTPGEFGLGFFGTLNPAPGVLLDFEVQATLTLADRNSVSGPFRTILSDPNGVLPDCIYEGEVVGDRLMPMPF